VKTPAKSGPLKMCKKLVDGKHHGFDRSLARARGSM
jgi:hypothetical protein